MFFEMRFDLGTLESGERSLPFGLLVFLSVGLFISGMPLFRLLFFGFVIISLRNLVNKISGEPLGLAS